jgi:Ca2+-dependent lipid-binding protein
MPSVRFDLQVLGGDISSLPFLEEWLQNVICNSLESYILPNKVSPYNS